MSESVPGDPAPSPWVTRFAALLPAHGRVLDLACGGGRHARWLAAQGWQVEAVDRDAAAIAALSAVSGVRARQVDLETPSWALAGERYDGIVVTNYLHRAHFSALLDCLLPAGVLIYETFMVGNERFGKPSSAAFLLQPQELLERVRGRCTVVAFEQGIVTTPRAAALQRLCALAGEAPPCGLPAA